VNLIMSFTTTQVLGVGSVCFIALTYRNLDLKYTMNERIEELEQSLERQKRENKLLRRELDAVRSKSFLSSIPDLLWRPLASWRTPKASQGGDKNPASYSGTV